MTKGFDVAWTGVEPGWQVLAADGSEVGKVEESVGDRDADIFEGIAVGVGLIGRSRFVPFDHVAGIAQGVVRLDLAPEQVDELPSYE
jgi:hypothetical protein